MAQGESTGSAVRWTWAHIRAPPPAGCVTLGKSCASDTLLQNEENITSLNLMR